MIGNIISAVGIVKLGGVTGRLSLYRVVVLLFPKLQPTHSTVRLCRGERKKAVLRIMTEAQQLICSTLVRDRECGSAGAQ